MPGSIPSPLVAPSLLSADFARLGVECDALERAGADWVHIDVMDGRFAPNLTFGPQTCAALRPHIRTVMDVHLMIAPADPHLQAFADSGADLLTAHVEAGPHVHRTLQTIRALGVKAGVALNPATPASAVSHVLDLVDLVLVMTVNPGFGGQRFIHSQLEKIRAVRALIGARPIRLQVDGGVTAETAPLAVAAGADVLVAGSAVFAGDELAREPSYRANISALRRAAGVAEA